MGRKSKAAKHSEVVTDTWNRVFYAVTHGHDDFISKAEKCDNYFAGEQWTQDDLNKLREQRRPALTINKILQQVSLLMGEQVRNRTDVVFRPRSDGATDDLATVMTKIFKQIADDNQLSWVRSDVFCDGVITSRGFFDVRLNFDNSTTGDLTIKALNPRAVIPDPDATEYDPDKWADVITTRWVSKNDVAILYGDAKAEEVSKSVDYWVQGKLQLENYTEGFKDRNDLFIKDGVSDLGVEDDSRRCIRLIERQYRKVDTTEVFLNNDTGDIEPIPEDWDAARRQEFLDENQNYAVFKDRRKRIRWSVIAGSVVLHDEWSPYSHFTVVPYFPYFRYGRSIGLVENLLSSQDQFNKISSQILHVINTTANSGWKVKTGSLRNMSMAELEERGAETGLNLELNDVGDAEKITANSPPTGLENMARNVEQDMRIMAGTQDSRESREDVSGKALQIKQNDASQSNIRPLDNLQRTDFLLARACLDIIQSYYSTERIIYITTDKFAREAEQVRINEITAAGEVRNDVTIGKYTIVVSSQPERDSLEDSQFEQIVSMRQDLGIPIPDDQIIKASRLMEKAELLTQMKEQGPPPEQVQEDRALKIQAIQADLQVKNAEAQGKIADAELKRAQARKAIAEVESAAADSQAAASNTVDPKEALRLELDAGTRRFQISEEVNFKREELAADMAFKREQQEQELQLKREEQAQERALEIDNQIDSIFDRPGA